jgi:hypothetical protein
VQTDKQGREHQVGHPVVRRRWRWRRGMVDVLETCRRVAGADTELEWVDSEFLVEQQVGPWMELPPLGWTRGRPLHARVS